MGVIESLQKRRTYYQIDKSLPVSEEKVVETVQEAVKLVPDAFNRKSQRVIVALGEKQNQLWDAVYDVFGGKVSREKIDGFRAGAGTVLYFTDESVVKALQEKFPLYAANFRSGHSSPMECFRSQSGPRSASLESGRIFSITIR